MMNKIHFFLWGTHSLMGQIFPLQWDRIRWSYLWSTKEPTQSGLGKADLGKVSWRLCCPVCNSGFPFTTFLLNSIKETQWGSAVLLDVPMFGFFIKILVITNNNNNKNKLVSFASHCTIAFYRLACLIFTAASLWRNTKAITVILPYVLVGRLVLEKTVKKRWWLAQGRSYEPILTNQISSLMFLWNSQASKAFLRLFHLPGRPSISASSTW